MCNDKLGYYREFLRNTLKWFAILDKIRAEEEGSGDNKPSKTSVFMRLGRRPIESYSEESDSEEKPSPAKSVGTSEDKRNVIAGPKGAGDTERLPGREYSAADWDALE